MSSRVICQGRDGVNIREMAVNSSGEMKITSGSALDVNLPTGASTASLQSTGNASLSSIDGKLASSVDTSDVTVTSSVLPTGAASETSLSALNTKVPSQGQALMASSLPVVIASNQSAVSVSSTASASSTTQTLTPAATSTALSTGLDTAGYNRIGFVIESDSVDVTAQVHYSHDDSSYFQLETAKTVVAVPDASGSNAMYTTYFSIDAVSKYVKIQVYNPNASGASVVVLANRIS
jgi:hypothetical protein